MIPLSYAWQAGAWQWTDEQREAFANDPAELRAVDGPTEQTGVRLSSFRGGEDVPAHLRRSTHGQASA